MEECVGWRRRVDSTRRGGACRRCLVAIKFTARIVLCWNCKFRWVCLQATIQFFNFFKNFFCCCSLSVKLIWKSDNAPKKLWQLLMPNQRQRCKWKSNVKLPTIDYMFSKVCSLKIIKLTLNCWFFFCYWKGAMALPGSKEKISLSNTQVCLKRSFFSSLFYLCLFVKFTQLLLRGCVLRNTEWVIGVVVFTGIYLCYFVKKRIFKRLFFICRWRNQIDAKCHSCAVETFFIGKSHEPFIISNFRRLFDFMHCCVSFKYFLTFIHL